MQVRSGALRVGFGCPIEVRQRFRVRRLRRQTDRRGCLPSEMPHELVRIEQRMCLEDGRLQKVCHSRA